MNDGASIHIGLSLSPTWLRSDAWRRPDSRVEDMFSLGFYVDVAKAAEAAHLDFVFKPDAPYLDPSVLSHSPGFSTLDAHTLVTALAPSTSHIGLVPTVHTAFASPFAVARQLQSLDNLSGSRAGWNVVTALGGSQNFGDAELPPSPLRYERAAEFVSVVQRLWESYPANALVIDRERGRFADTTHLRPIDHHGQFFDVAGPMTLPQTASARLPVVQAGASPSGREFAAQSADIVFIAAPTTAAAVEQRNDLRTRAANHGRQPGDIRVLPGLNFFLASTADSAQRLAEESEPAGPSGAAHWTFVGTPEALVTQILERFRAGALDGVIALPGGSWDSLGIFLDQVVPMLVELGIFRDSYPSSTFAGNLGL